MHDARDARGSILALTRDMRLQSARDLKDQLLQDVVLPVANAASALGIHAVAARARAGVHAPAIFAVGARPFEALPDVQRSVALGVAPHKDGYRLAVRVQRQALLSDPLVEHLVREARNEADVRMIGRIDKRARRRATATATAAPWFRGNVRPLVIGASIGHFRVTAGTLGAFVERGNELFVLSNNHVLANEDDAASGDWILQRARLDGGRQPRDRVARLRHWIRFKRRKTNFVDAALGALDDGIEIDPTLLRGITGRGNRRLAGLGPEMVDEGDTVYKVGRTTGATRGRVTAFDLDNVVVGYDVGNVRFDGQIEIEGAGKLPFSDGGDSGSLIVDRRMEAVALLFAGSETGGRDGLGLTYANPIHRVLDDLKATLLW